MTLLLSSCLTNFWGITQDLFVQQIWVPSGYPELTGLTFIFPFSSLCL